MSYKERLENGIQLCCTRFEQFQRFNDGKYWPMINMDDFYFEVWESDNEDNDILFDCTLLTDDETCGPLRMRFCPFCGTKLPLLERIC